MPIQVNLRHLETNDQQLSGELLPAELDITKGDEMIQVVHPLRYDFSVQKMETGLLLQGRLELPLECGCVRCLKPFQYTLQLDPWSLHLPLEGEDAVPVVNDSVDLTPYVREDILLEFPQHPLCDQECRGLPQISDGEPDKGTSSNHHELGSPAWEELNKLKL